MPRPVLRLGTGGVAEVWELPKIRGTVFWGPYNKDVLLLGSGNSRVALRLSTCIGLKRLGSFDFFFRGWGWSDYRSGDTACSRPGRCVGLVKGFNDDRSRAGNDW